MNKAIQEKIEHFAYPSSFTYARPDEKTLQRTQAKLGVTLPKQFKEFLEEYGHGGFNGFEILGVGISGAIVFEKATLEYREHNLPNNLVVVENCDEWLYCIDCNNESIVSWDLEGHQQKEYDCFDEFLLDRLSDAIENL